MYSERHRISYNPNRIQRRDLQNQNLYPIDRLTVTRTETGIIPHRSTSSNALIEQGNTNDKSSNHSNDNNDRTSNAEYGIGITGFDRLTNPFYNPVAKFGWFLFFLGLIGFTLYQMTTFFHQFVYITPGINVYFENRDEVIVPRSSTCPAEFFRWNPISEKYRKRYKELFRVPDDQEIFFSDLLNLPGMNLTQLWSLFPIDTQHFSVTVNCSTSKTDKHCIPNFTIQEIMTSGGRCISVFNLAPVKFHPSTSMELMLNLPPEIKLFQNSLPYARGINEPVESNVAYFPISYGIPSTATVKAICALEIFELHNLNLHNNPCEDKWIVEKCIDDCVEGPLFELVTCRLPFMNTTKLKDCVTPDEFNKSWEISSDYLRLARKKCQHRCPRKCSEVLIVVNIVLEKVKQSHFHLSIRRFDSKVLVIKEYKWYSVSNLIADLGGSLGFFLDITVLTLVEFIDFVIRQILKAKKSKINPQSQTKTIKQNYLFFLTRRNRRSQINRMLNDPNNLKVNIGIVGCDRILNSKYNMRLRIMWLIWLCISLTICTVKIRTAVRSYINTDPDVRFELERNETVTYPTVTFCPYRPFHTWNYFRDLKELYEYEFNGTDMTSLTLSDLQNLPDINITSFWSDDFNDALSENDIVLIDPTGRSLYQMLPTGENYTIVYRHPITINGKCLSITITPSLEFKGTGTSASLVMRRIINEGFRTAFSIHPSEDDPRTFHPNSWRLVPDSGFIGVSPIYVRKREFLNRKGYPCSDPQTVADCRSKCYDTMLEKIVDCRIPFIKNTTMKLCTTSASFNRTYTAAMEITLNHSALDWCNCPRKCSDYIYGIHSNMIRTELSLAIFILQFANNLFQVTREYRQMTLNSLFANICGDLGLFLGFSALTILEIIEAIWIKMWKKK